MSCLPQKLVEGMFFFFVCCLSRSHEVREIIESLRLENDQNPAQKKSLRPQPTCLQIPIFLAFPVDQSLNGKMPNKLPALNFLHCEHFSNLRIKQQAPAFFLRTAGMRFQPAPNQLKFCHVQIACKLLLASSALPLSLFFSSALALLVCGGFAPPCPCPQNS